MEVEKDLENEEIKVEKKERKTSNFGTFRTAKVNNLCSEHLRDERKRFFSLRPGKRFEYDDQTLLDASFQGNFTQITLLLDSGANINVIDKNGWNALHCAASQGHFHICLKLIERGINIKHRNL